MTALFRYAQLSYEVLVETVTEPIVTTDQDFRTIQWNSAAERKFGYSSDHASASHVSAWTTLLHLC
jgi:PAS domain S-box-containing protein